MEEYFEGPATAKRCHTLFDVAVIGLGPVGAAAALLLARQGLRVFAVDTLLTPYDKPRAIGIDHEALRMLQKLGITEGFEPFMGAYRPSEYRSATGEILRRIIPQPEPHPLAWPPYSTFIQPELERLLREAFARYSSLDVVLGSRCADLIQNDEGVELTLETGETSERQLIRAKYVVACDGASSPIREGLGLKLENLDFDEPWLVVDVHVGADVVLPDAIVQYCDPERPITLVHGPGNLRRWEIMLKPGEVPAEMLEEAVIWALLSKWLRPDQGKIWRAATYQFHALVGEQWRKDRVFIAGDAAHQTPPFMAQGLNQGFRDVINLSWKLAEVLTGRANEALLDSYDEERRPNARAVIELTKTFGRIICERDPVAAAQRDRKMLDEMASGRGEIVRQDLLPPLSGGFLLREGEGLSPGAGSIFPQPWVKRPEGARVRMDDVLPAGYLLFVRPDWKSAQGSLDLAAELGVTIVSVGGKSADGVTAIDEEEGVIRDWFDRHQVSSVLVRPDHVIFGSLPGEDAAFNLLSSLKAAVEKPIVPPSPTGR